MSSDLHQIAADRLRRQDQRYTPTRQALVSVLASGPPMTLPELLEANKGLPQSSAYRNLGLLEEAGIVRRIAGGEFARYELAEDLTEHHHHFICSACGAVDDFTLPADLEEAVEKALFTAARKRKFRGAHHRLDLMGVCAGCT